jgi:2-oxo-4-hydroxy-4-carboxy--5-ureidoimidazoline (OHCU) decarboxylase
MEYTKQSTVYQLRHLMDMKPQKFMENFSNLFESSSWVGLSHNRSCIQYVYSRVREELQKIDMLSEIL